MKRILLLTSLIVMIWMGGACAPSLDVEETAETVAVESESAAVDQVISGMILPHHELAKDLIEEAWLHALEEEPDLIVLIGPDHPGLADHPLIWTSETSVSLPNVISPLAEDWIEAGLGEAAVAADHSIETPLKVLLSETMEIPVLALTLPRGLDGESVDRIVKSIQDLEGECLLVGSVDFSHGLDSQASRAKDEESWTWIQNRNLDAIRNAGNEYFDSPETIEILLRCVEGDVDQVKRSDSSDFGWSKVLPGTSYQVIQFYEG